MKKIILFISLLLLVSCSNNPSSTSSSTNPLNKLFFASDLEEKDFIFEDHEVSEVIWMEFEKCYQAVKNNKINHCIYLEELDMIGEYLRDCQE